MLHDLSSSIVGRLILAAILGGVIGLERELRHKPSGLRTNMLIGFGAALFTIISFEMARHAGDDHTRIAAQIIPGIGFIGAGVVIRERGAILGITSAATIFVVASIGMAAGAGLPVTAVFATLLALVALIFFSAVENKFGLHTRVMAFRLVSQESRELVSRTHQIVEAAGLQPHRWQTHSLAGESSVEFDAEVTSAQERDLLTRLSVLNAHVDVHYFRP